jgi:NADP-dependent 3-hydroxy acid dehydrogenase YdfG
MPAAMTKTLVICGYGTGISQAVAERFGAAGFRLALVARNKEKLAESVKTLKSKKIKARAFRADLSSPKAVRGIIARVQKAFGPIAAIHWNPYGQGAGELLTIDKKELDAVMDVSVMSLLAAVQTALPDLKEQKGAVLVTNGGLGYARPEIDAMGIEWKAAGLSIANAAKHKLVALLAHQLRADEIYVGEVVVLSVVKGTAWDQGQGTLEASAVAEKFWELHEGRSVTSVDLAG